MNSNKGYIYIMTNPSFEENTVKIGFATDVEERRKQLSTTALPYEYETYAIYETQGNLEDKKLHKMIDRINPTIRVNEKREFYRMSAEDAYSILESIAIISGTIHKLHRVKYETPPCEDEPVVTETNSTELKSTKKSCKFKFSMVHIPVGSNLIYKDDPSIVCTTVDDVNRVSYKGKEYTLSGLVKELRYSIDKDTRNTFTYQGPIYFKYNGKILTDLRAEVESQP